MKKVIIIQDINNKEYLCENGFSRYLDHSTLLYDNKKWAIETLKNKDLQKYFFHRFLILVEVYTNYEH